MQSKFIESYADKLRDDVSGDLALPSAPPLAQPDTRGVRQVSASKASGRQSRLPNVEGIHSSVEQVQMRGRRTIETQRSSLEALTKDATGVSADRAMRVNEWPE